MLLGKVKRDQRTLWLTALVTCILVVQSGVVVVSFAILPTGGKVSLHVNNNFLFLEQRQLSSLRLPVETSIASSTNSNNNNSNTESTIRSNEQRRMGELTKSEQVAYDILCELSKSEYSFRIVVIGKNGSAILESTVPCFGPKIKILQSPSTGANMATLANEDQSFEYHIQLEQIGKISFVEKEAPNKTLRIVRLLNDSGESITSLILVDVSDDAQKWFGDMIQRHGSTVQL